ncbi:odorant binding protein 11 [Nomia melanderi]|uniref:odorant binding protein 11 n=1 Tax=Nomia melanderi TaxID=2448451 RepID=UPI001304266F|nr:general odorant-binding protein 99a-like isoform X2 [Nomia melanderi]
MKLATEVSSILFCVLISRFLLIHAEMVTKEDFKEMTAATRKKCLAETKATLQAVEDTEYGEFPDDDRLKCYFKCCLEKFGLMNRKSGEIKYNLLKTAIPTTYRQVVSGMIDNCTDIGGNDNCEKAFNFMQCMYDQNSMYFIAP